MNANERLIKQIIAKIEAMTGGPVISLRIKNGP